MTAKADTNPLREALEPIIKNLDDLDKQRTPGPWKKTHDNITVPGTRNLVARCDADWNSFAVDIAKASKNARFIVALENAWPKLRAALASEPVAGTVEPRKAHMVMTPNEYATMFLIGWHEACKDVDGFGGVGVRYLGVAPPAPAGRERRLEVEITKLIYENASISYFDGQSEVDNSDHLARLILAALSPQPRGATLPAEPTQAMIIAGCEANPTQWTDSTPDSFAADVANDVYRAMVAAAPTPPAPGAADRAKAFCEWLQGYFEGDLGKEELTAFEANQIRAELNERFGAPANTGEMGR